MAKEKKFSKRKTTKVIQSNWSIPLSKTNFIYFALGLIALVIGFYLMTIPPWDSVFALVISPIILIVSYFILFPLGILKKIKQGSE